MKAYEGMFIFPDALKDEALDTAIAGARAEIERHGGTVENTTRLGRRSFARALGKETAGHYVVFGFQMEGDQVTPLLERLKLSDEVLRAQVMRAAPAAVEAESSEEKGAQDDAESE